MNNLNHISYISEYKQPLLKTKKIPTTSFEAIGILKNNLILKL